MSAWSTATEPELAAMRSAYSALAPLDTDSLRTAMLWLNAKIEAELNSREYVKFKIKEV